MAGGTLNVPNTFQTQSGNVPASKLDDNNTTIETYVNNREGEVGLIAARPVAGTRGNWFLATDVNGGTLYLDSGTAWTPAGAGVTLASNTPVILSAQGGDSTLTGSVAETSLKSFTVPAAQLATNSDALRICVGFRASGAAGTKRLRVKFGATTIADSTAITLSANEIIWVEARVIRTGAATQRGTAYAALTASGAAWTTTVTGGTTSTAPAETLSGTVIIDVTGQLGNVADIIVCDYLSVEYMNAV